MMIVIPRLRALALATVLLSASACSSSDAQDSDGGGGTGGGSGLNWYATCGYPLCGPGDAGTPSGVAACTTEKAGAACTTKEAMCDPGTGCGVMLRCTNADPRAQIGGCPISRRSYKRDIHYLDDAQLATLESQIRALPLARYRYKDAPARERLGFMIDDAPASPAVDEPRDMIDLYAYTSMVVATVQRQANRLDAQDREIARLRVQLARLERSARHR